MEAILFIVGFMVMEPVTYWAHRYIFHGFGYGVHQSHHEPPEGGFELNDFYPGISALITMSIIATGIFIPGLTFLIPFGFGVSLYGTIYFFIHDVVIHQRFKFLRIKKDLFRWHDEAHRIHHRFGGEPYGLLFPIVPSRLRRLALNSEENSLSLLHSPLTRG